MDIVFAIVAFVVFSLISDAIEGYRKKRRQADLPPQREQERRERIDGEIKRRQKKAPDIVLPPIKNAPSGARTRAAAGASAAAQSQYAAALARPRREAAAALPPMPEAATRQGADIHTDVLLNAIAYAQILQPPKAYQYMATRSCRGEWNNQK